MHNEQNKSGGILIIATFIILIIYNIFYASGKFLSEAAPAFVQNIYSGIKTSWGLFTFLEFLAVASLFVDLIVKYDLFEKRQRNFRLLLTVILFVSFGFHFIVGLMEKYITGEVH
ncbi:MAG: hypothetical protein SH856_09265 [Flavobacteriales bacterium]|nr:hypothetical protein [Flavobacteriales bacterium]